MTTGFEFTPEGDTSTFRLRVAGRVVPRARWAIEAPREAVPGVDVLTRLEASGQVVDGDYEVVVADEAIAELDALAARALGLPPLTDLVLALKTTGVVTSPTFEVLHEWRTPAGQGVPGAERVGAWLRRGSLWQRLGHATFAIARAAEKSRQASDDAGERLSALARIRELLPIADEQGSATAMGFIANITISEADAFSLDWVGEGGAADLVPVLHRAGADTAVLDEEQQKAFLEKGFFRFQDVRSAYSVAPGHFIVLSPLLRRCLSEVRAMRAAPLARRRAFFAEPRRFLRTILEAEDDPTLLESLENIFVETAGYSQRVIGLGFWKPRVVPWIAREASDWFGPDAAPQAGASVRGGLSINGENLPLSLDAIGELQRAIAHAAGRGEASVEWQSSDGRTVQVPATSEVSAALERLADTLKSADTPVSKATPPKAPGEVAVLILTNEGDIEFRQEFEPRPDPGVSHAGLLNTIPKQHQEEGIRWLQACWRAGRPGVVLADDMGLGKTLQGLAFLAWIRAGMEAGKVRKSPILIVAPTGLLANWIAEHDRHLVPPGLGQEVRAFGAALRQIREIDDSGTPRLNQDALRGADWVLTTYETLRDYSQDFAAVHFAVLMADEAQKVKSPGIRLTDAFKAMNATFRVALTGTPVENRLADIWCIVDGIHPGYLGDLKGFSLRYEREDPDIERLQELKQQLDQPFGGAPPLLLRRLKHDHLPDLPPMKVVVREEVFPEQQRTAYEKVLSAVRDVGGGGVLAALQQLRSVSLHPDSAPECSDQDFIAASARMVVLFRELDTIAHTGEKAIVFLENLEVLPRLAGIIQRRYRLRHPPSIINGEMIGHERQRHVDEFQRRGPGFDCILLSPRAGGVGLTLTEANHVIHLSRWWNPAVEDQCSGRAHRIGQSKPVMVYLPMGVFGDGRTSFDQNLHALLEKKRQLMEEALLPPGFSQQESEELLRRTLG
jgi:hypothetical protein